MSTDVARSQRDAIRQLSPPWLAGGSAEKYLYAALGLPLDALLEKWNEAIQSRLPGAGDPSFLPVLGADRVMGQGINETNAAFAARLTKAFDTWQRAGSRRSVLQQVLGYVANTANVQTGQVPIGAMVNVTGAGASWDVFYSTDNLSNPPAHRVVSPTNWNWDGTNSWWWSFLVLYFPVVQSTTTGAAASVTALSGGFATVTGLTGMTSSSVGQMLTVSGAASSANNGIFQIAQYLSSSSVTIANPSAVAADANNGTISWTLGSYPAVGPAPAFGTPGATIGTNSSISIGLSVSNQFISGLRGLVRLWKSANNFVPWMIVSFGGVDGTAGKEFSPLSTQGSGNPDGTWATWAKTSAGVSVAARSTGTTSASKFDAFCDGTAIYQQAWVPTGA